MNRNDVFLKKGGRNWGRVEVRDHRVAGCGGEGNEGEEKRDGNEEVGSWQGKGAGKNGQIKHQRPVIKHQSSKPTFNETTFTQNVKLKKVLENLVSKNLDPHCFKTDQSTNITSPINSSRFELSQRVLYSQQTIEPEIQRSTKLDFKYKSHNPSISSTVSPAPEKPLKEPAISKKMKLKLIVKEKDASTLSQIGASSKYSILSAFKKKMNSEKQIALGVTFGSLIKSNHHPHHSEVPTGNSSPDFAKSYKTHKLSQGHAATNSYSIYSRSPTNLSSLSGSNNLYSQRNYFTKVEEESKQYFKKQTNHLLLETQTANSNL